MPLLMNKTGDITADTEWDLDVIDASKIRAIMMHIVLEAPTGLVTDTLDVYFQTRDQTGVWVDRAHSSQYLGNGAAQDQMYTILSWPPLSQTEESGTPPGPTPLAARLDADSVRHGIFPTVFYEELVNYGGPIGRTKRPSTNMRVSFDKGGAGTPTFPVTVFIEAVFEDQPF